MINAGSPKPLASVEHIRETARRDVFTDFALLLRPASRYDLENRIREKYLELPVLLTNVKNPATGIKQKPPFFCVLDEAQITMHLRYGDFIPENDSSEHSALREIWLSWTWGCSIANKCAWYSREQALSCKHSREQRCRVPSSPRVISSSMLLVRRPGMSG